MSLDFKNKTRCFKIGIRVNCIAPGVIKTNFSRALWEDNEDQFKDQFFMGRAGTSEEISGTAAFLCSEDAR